MGSLAIFTGVFVLVASMFYAIIYVSTVDIMIIVSLANSTIGVISISSLLSITVITVVAGLLSFTTLTVITGDVSASDFFLSPPLSLLLVLLQLVVLLS